MEWIDVNDRVPGYFDVLVYVSSETDHLCGVDIGRYFGGDGWAFGNGSAYEYNEDIAKVTHWMLMPQPPEPKS